MGTPEDIYRLLEEKMLGYSEVNAVPVAPIDEPLVAIVPTTNLLVNPIEPKMREITGDDIYVRETVAQMLEEASVALAGISKSLQFEVVYGYRHPEIQAASFNALKAKIAAQNTDLTGVELIEATNRFVAAPENAGHPTGGAVDLTLRKDGKQLDMGTPAREFTPDTYVFSPFISKEAWKNRQMLRRFMTGIGFAPYDGEWWHFSFGDKEWAAYYGKPHAVYGQVDFRPPKTS